MIVARVATHLRDTPVETLTLRGVGRALGTSAYPVVYHFGSRRALLDAVVAHLEDAAARVPLAPDDDDAGLADWFVAQFGRLDDPERRLAARLAFELGAVEHLHDVRRHRQHHERQTAAVTAWCGRHGIVDPEARARDAVQHARGVQWDCVLRGDPAGVDTAVRRVAGRLASAGPTSTV